MQGAHSIYSEKPIAKKNSYVVTMNKKKAKREMEKK